MADDILYDDQHIGFLEDLWGPGFLSPGGADEVARVLEGVDVQGKRVLDIGSGSGACAILLAGAYGAAHVTGIDIEAPVCAAARRRIAHEGMEAKIDILEVAAEPLPFQAAEFDLVFSKDSIIHIDDKAALAKDVYRVLKPGGRLAASDWLISHDGAPSEAMSDYIRAEGLDFAMASPARYRQAIVEAGFVEVELVNRNRWYAKLAAEEAAWLRGPERASLSERYGKDFIDLQVTIWGKLVGVLDRGEHCPHHIRGRKPA